jgi:hypothetical protein
MDVNCVHRNSQYLIVLSAFTHVCNLNASPSSLSYGRYAILQKLADRGRFSHAAKQP